MSSPKILSDEPAERDQLGRADFAKALATVAKTSQTPLVIGLFGRWGVGKTSLMRLIEAESESDGTIKCVWFDAWRHQFDDHPALGLMHALADQFKIQDLVKKTLTSVARALGSWALKATTTIDIKDVENALRSYEDENFRIQDERARLFQSFQEVVRKARESIKTKEQPGRIVFFIDDLDRCLPNQILAVLESLKLFLNLEGCVYFLGVDRYALETSIRHYYENREIDEVNYLDKIIQLPFTIPPIAPDSVSTFINSLLPPELAPCREILEKGLGGNPRGIKRFINTLLLNQSLAAATLDDPKVEILAVLLLIQYKSPELYSAIAGNLKLLDQIVDDSEAGQEIREQYPAADNSVLEAVRSVDFTDRETLRSYFYLTSVARVMQEEIQDEQGFYTEAGLDALLAESGKLAKNESVREHLLLLSSEKQHTWLITTNQNLWCLLDDEQTRSKGIVIQWKQVLNKTRNIKAYRSLKGTPVVELGAKNPWIYSEYLHPNPQKLVENISAIIERASE